jgi:hypothetical protein
VFAITINKAQGETFKHAGIYQPLSVFPSGQLMVAFSQSSSYDNIAAASIDGQCQCTENDRLITLNILQQEVL